ncbi:DUF4328 domain-containing protein [Kineococcus endophyticus]|uniref:DUF4328 domain-containing protein n=1 Tax=Kineococcus endophyticus TaxID=1181883 RepID=A0ABV3P2F0_9ACTN
MDGPQASWQQSDPGSPWVLTPPPAGPLEPVGGLATAVLVLSAVVVAVDLLTALSSFGADPTSAFGVAPEVFALSTVCWLATLVVTSVWLLRVRRNAERMSPFHHHVRSRGWAWAGWMVPVVCWWFPFQVVRDALTASAAAHPGRLPRPPLALWWGTWVASQALTSTSSWVGGGVGPAAGTVQLLGVAVLGVALAAWVRVVRTATALQTP